MSDIPYRAQRVKHEELCAGIRIEDPYHWMEEETSEREEWCRSQEQYTKKILDHLTCRDLISRRLHQLFKVTLYSSPVSMGNRLFWFQKNPDKDLPALMMQDINKGTTKVLIDPESSDSQLYSAISAFYPSDDGQYVAFAQSSNENSSRSLQILHVDSNEIFEEIIPEDLYPMAQCWPGENQIVWTSDNSGFYYTRRPFTVSENEHSLHQKLYFHKIGDDVSMDKLIYGGQLRKTQIPYPSRSPDGRYLLINIMDMSRGEPETEIYIQDTLNAHLGFVVVLEDTKGTFKVKVSGDRLYLLSNAYAKNWDVRSIAIKDVFSGEFKLQIVIPECNAPIRSWAITQDYILLESIEEGSSNLLIYHQSGDFHTKVQMIIPGCIKDMHVKDDNIDIFFEYASFFIPPTIYSLKPGSGDYYLWEKSDPVLEQDLFEINHVNVASADNTMIPVSIVHNKTLHKNGDTPVVIYGYGGFGLSILPEYNPAIIPFLESGGIYVIAHIRGGGDKGEDWHRQGVKEKKQNVFDDFIAVAEYMISEDYTSNSRMACYGWSNGGLLVNSVAQQRPDLWKAVISGAPVTDMARFHLANHGRQWVSDYGDPENTADLKTLLSYSPYHNIPEQIDAPAILMVVPEKDDRVAPWHGYKMLAKWQHGNRSKRPVLLLREMGVGHKGATSIKKTIERFTNIWSFIFWQLGVKVTQS